MFKMTREPVEHLAAGFHEEGRRVSALLVHEVWTPENLVINSVHVQHGQAAVKAYLEAPRLN